CVPSRYLSLFPYTTLFRSISGDRLFDATVGRYILMYLPDPAGVLRSLSRLLRPGGVLAFQDATWAPVLALSAQRPLWSACASLIDRKSTRLNSSHEWISYA